MILGVVNGVIVWHMSRKKERNTSCKVGCQVSQVYNAFKSCETSTSAKQGLALRGMRSTNAQLGS